MPDMEQSDHAKRIEREIRWCFVYEPGKRMSCAGASGRKLRQTCVWCDNYRKGVEKENETGN